MARHKLTDAGAYHSWEDVNEGLRRLGELEGMLERMEQDMTQQIAGVKSLHQQAAAPLQEQMTAIKYDIEAYASAHRSEVQGKTKVLPCGRTGWRHTTHIQPPRGAAAVLRAIEALKARGLRACIRTKETLDKEELRALPDPVLTEIGAKRVEADEWWCEAERSKIVDMH